MPPTESPSETPLDRVEMIRRRDTAARLGVFRPELHVIQNLSEEEAMQIWRELIPFAPRRPVPQIET